jgi:glyoxylase-like metal-dependent hydrolase (beta-lactamase superfamily II)
VVTDGVNRFKLPDNLVSNAKREDVIAALAAARLPPDIFVTPYNPIVVNTGQRLVVIDTGLGEAGFNATKGVNGQFLTNLAAAGIDAKACRHHLALPRRPRERPVEGGQFARLSQCRDSGAGG